MHLAPNIYIARIDCRSVILDLNRDRYIGLNANLSEAIQRVYSSSGEGGQRPADRGAIIKLYRHGLLTSQSKPKSRGLSQQVTLSQATVPQPTSSLWAKLPDERAPNELISSSGMMSALVSLTQVAASLQFRSFKSTIDWLAKTKISAPHRDAPWSAQALVDAFAEVRPYFPLKPICRLDALSLCLHLRHNGQDARLVFGARLDPFKAHCWVQIGEIAISEAWDRLRQYSPILVV